MSDYTTVINQIDSATSIAQISQIVSSYSASAVGAGGILYSGSVGSSSTNAIALSIVSANAANGITVNIIDKTPRGQMLADAEVKAAILNAAQNIYTSQGMTTSAAASAAGNFLFGSNAIAAGNYTGPNGVISALNTYYSTQVYVPGTQTVMRGYAQLALDVLNNTGVGSVANQEVADAIGRASYTTAFQAKLAFQLANQDFADIQGSNDQVPTLAQVATDHEAVLPGDGVPITAWGGTPYTALGAAGHPPSWLHPSRQSACGKTASSLAS